jgi:hypothetical protein
MVVGASGSIDVDVVELRSVEDPPQAPRVTITPTRSPSRIDTVALRRFDGMVDG